MDNQQSLANQAFKAILKDLAIGNPNRRDVDRVPWRSAVKLQPIDADLNSVGDSMQAFSSDISRVGLGLITAMPVEHEYVKIEVPDSELSMFGQVVHATDIGDDYPQYLIGVRFLT